MSCKRCGRDVCKAALMNLDPAIHGEAGFAEQYLDCWKSRATRAEQLADALEEFVEHRGDCDAWGSDDDGNRPPCSCGLAEVMSKLAQHAAARRGTL